MNFIQQAINFLMQPDLHLKNSDKVLAQIIGRIKLNQRRPNRRYFEALGVAIINQQLSTKAADTIEKRFRGLFDSRAFPSVKQVLSKSSAAMRKAGLSLQKIKYIRGIAQAIVKKEVDFKTFKNLSDEEIINSLTKLKGVGRWTAEMFLMSSMGRPDVFSHGDLGLKNAIKKWYKLELKKHPKKYYQLVESWRPHRTTAARYLWASLNLGNE